nr:MAG TPA: hypothetical protein [Caudoviricetes sp.]
MGEPTSQVRAKSLLSPQGDLIEPAVGDCDVAHQTVGGVCSTVSLLLLRRVSCQVGSVPVSERPADVGRDEPDRVVFFKKRPHLLVFVSQADHLMLRGWHSLFFLLVLVVQSVCELLSPNPLHKGSVGFGVSTDVSNLTLGGFVGVLAGHLSGVCQLVRLLDLLTKDGRVASNFVPGGSLLDHEVLCVQGSCLSLDMRGLTHGAGEDDTSLGFEVVGTDSTLGEGDQFHQLLGLSARVDHEALVEVLVEHVGRLALVGVDQCARSLILDPARVNGSQPHGEGASVEEGDIPSLIVSWHLRGHDDHAGPGLSLQSVTLRGKVEAERLTDRTQGDVGAVGSGVDGGVMERDLCEFLHGVSPPWLAVLVSWRRLTVRTSSRSHLLKAAAFVKRLRERLSSRSSPRTRVDVRVPLFV